MENNEQLKSWDANGSFAQQIAGQLDETLDRVYKKTALTWLRMFAAIGVSFLLMKEIIAKYLLHDFFVIWSWSNILIYYILIVAVGVVIYLITDAIVKLLLYITR